MSKSYSKPAILVNGKPYAIFYGHTEPYTIKELAEAKIYRIKAGRSTNSNIKSYRRKRMQTNDLTGKRFLWWENIFEQYLNGVKLSLNQAAKIAGLADTLFKRQMRLAGYQANIIHKGEPIGDEVYESNDLDSLEAFIKKAFKESLLIAYKSILKKNYKTCPKPKQFTPRPGQVKEFINPHMKYFKDNDVAIAAVHGGSGKTKMSCRISELVCKTIYKSNWKVIGFANNRPNTIQLAYEFSKYYEGQTGNKNLNIYIVGSIDENELLVHDGCINIISKSEKVKLAKVLKDFYNSKKDCAIFVVNDSAYGFLELAVKSDVNFKKWFCIKDEVHTIVNENDVAKLETNAACAIVNPKFRHLFGKTINLTATPINRPAKCKNPKAVFNDDIEKFGRKVVTIDELKARQLGWICDVECIILPIPADPLWIKSIKERRPFELNLFGEPINVYPHIYPVIESIRKYIIPNGKKHIIVNCGLYKDVDSIIYVLQKLKDNGYIPKDFSIIRGSARTAQSDVNRFNNAEKSIIVATRWIGTGQDTYKADVVIPCYNPKSKAYRKQFLMRKDRLTTTDKVSWFVLPAIETQIEDSVWYEYCEYIANGLPVEIISEADFINPKIPNKVVGGKNNPKAGSNFGNSNIKLVKNNDPILYEEWLQLSNAIAERKYTDQNGNSRFSKIMEKYSLDNLKKYNSFIQLLNENYKLYNYIWETNDEKVADKLFSKYADYKELPNTETSLKNYIHNKWKKRPTKYRIEIEQMLRTKFSVILK